MQFIPILLIVVGLSLFLGVIYTANRRAQAHLPSSNRTMDTLFFLGLAIGIVGIILTIF